MERNEDRTLQDDNDALEDEDDDGYRTPRDHSRSPRRDGDINIQVLPAAVRHPTGRARNHMQFARRGRSNQTAPPTLHRQGRREGRPGAAAPRTPLRRDRCASVSPPRRLQKRRRSSSASSPSRSPSPPRSRRRRRAVRSPSASAPRRSPSAASLPPDARPSQAEKREYPENAASTQPGDFVDHSSVAQLTADGSPRNAFPAKSDEESRGPGADEAI